MKSQPEKPVVRLQLPAIGCCMRRVRSVPGVNMGEATRLRVLVTSAQCGNPRLTSPLPAPPRPGPRHRATGARWRHHRQWSQLSPVAPASRSRAPIPDTGACTVIPASPLPTVSMIRLKCVLVLAYATIFLTATALSNTWSVARHYII